MDTAEEPQAEKTGRSFGEWVKDVWHEGMVRHAIAEKDGRRVLDLPLTLVLGAALIAPWLLVIGVLLAVVFHYEMRFERRDSGGEAAGGDETGEAPLAPSHESVDIMAEE